MNSDAQQPVEDPLQEGEESFKQALRLINSLESQGVIGRYAIGGFVGIIFYSEPFGGAYDLDIFTDVAQSEIPRVYEHLSQEGYKINGDHVLISAIPVRFFAPENELLQDALATCVETSFADVPTRVFQYEHLLAINAQLGGPFNALANILSIDSAAPDEARLNELLERFGLLEKWRQCHPMCEEGQAMKEEETTVQFPLEPVPVEEYLEAVYRSKAQVRRRNAKLPIEEKIRTVIELQYRNRAFKLGGKRPYRLPWGLESDPEQISVKTGQA